MNVAYAFDPAPAPASQWWKAPDRQVIRNQTPADRLLGRLSPDWQLTGLGVGVLRIVRLTEHADRDLHELQQALIAEPFIAQKLIRSANVLTAAHAAVPATTVSRAIVVLGLDQVRAIASSTALLDHLEDRQQALRVQEEFAQTLYATTLARTLASAGVAVDGDEAAVCTLFRRFGRLLAAMLLYPQFEDALALARTERLSESRAAARTMGMGFDRLGIEVLNRWQLPGRIAQAALPSPHIIRPTGNTQVLLRILAQFCSEVAETVRVPSPASRRHGIELLLQRYGEGLSLQRKQLTAALRTTDERAQQIGNALGIFGIGAAGDCLEDGNRMRLRTSNRSALAPTLSAGVASLSHMLEREQAPDAILMHAVQVLRRAFDFQRVLLCEAHGIAAGYRLTHLDGKRLHGAQPHGVIEPTGADLFSAALLKGADVCIGEATDERVQRALPRWHRTACPDARSFLILTLAARNAPIGFVYADYARSNPSRLSEEEVALLKTIKAQIGLALKKAAHDRPVCA